MTTHDAETLLDALLDARLNIEGMRTRRAIDVGWSNKDEKAWRRANAQYAEMYRRVVRSMETAP